eukprot:622098_1
MAAKTINHGSETKRIRSIETTCAKAEIQKDSTERKEEIQTQQNEDIGTEISRTVAQAKECDCDIQLLKEQLSIHLDDKASDDIFKDKAPSASARFVKQLWGEKSTLALFSAIKQG